MPVASSKKIIELAQAADPKTTMLKAIGDLTNEHPLWDLVLVMTYIQPERRKSGLYVPEDILREDEYQGVVGLVVKLGDEAAAQRDVKHSQGFKHYPDVGSWVQSSIKDGHSLTVNGCPCREVPYDCLRMSISGPKVIYDA